MCALPPSPFHSFVRSPALSLSLSCARALSFSRMCARAFPLLSRPISHVSGPSLWLYLSACVCVVCMSVCLSVCLSACPPACLCIVGVCVCVRVWNGPVPFLFVVSVRVCVLSLDVACLPCWGILAENAAALVSHASLDFVSHINDGPPYPPSEAQASSERMHVTPHELV